MIKRKMKRLLSFLVVLVVISNLAFGQNTDPKVILDKMSETYKAMPGFEVAFVQKVMNESEVSDAFSGVASVSKEKFLLKLSGQHIYSNGPVIWTYLVDSQELTISNFDDDGGINPTNVYDIYKEGFDYKYLRSENLKGDLVDVIELSSTDEDSDYTKVIMYINQKDSYLKGWDMVDYDDINTSFEVSSFKPNMNFPEKYFEFDTVANKVLHTEDLRD